jgi:hypothetical protein
MGSVNPGAEGNAAVTDVEAWVEATGGNVGGPYPIGPSDVGSATDSEEDL